MSEGVTLAFMLASVIMLGFVGDHLFKRTGIPDMLFLIALGVLFGPILGVFDPASIMSLAPYIAALSLVIILFDAGLRMSIYEVFSESPRAALLATVGFVVALLTLTVFLHVALGLPLLYASLFGALYGGGGSCIAVLSLVTRVHISPKCQTVLSLESVIDDVLCTVGSLVIIGILLTGNAEYTMIAKDIASQFSIGAVIGAVLGLGWLGLLRKVEKEPYAYILTLAAAFLAYSVAESLGGNGALASLLFGLVLGNEGEILKILRRNPTRSATVDAGMKRFQEEVAFFIRSFFFVYLGFLTVALNLNALVWGVILAFLLLVIRVVTVRVATIRSPLRKERGVMSMVLTRGLVAAILATIPMQVGLLYADLYLNITLIVIMLTAIFSTVGAFVLGKEKQ